MRVSVAVVAVALLAGCPARGPANDATQPGPADGVAPGSSAVAATGSGTLSVHVADDKGRPAAGTVVWVVGLKASTPVPAEPAVLEQKDLEFSPPLLVARVGQKLLARNDDRELHNVNVSAPCCTWNVIVAPGATSDTKLEGPGLAWIFCNIHSHMRACVLVLDSDYAITDATGSARLAGVPAGSWTLRAQAFDRARVDVSFTLADGATADVKVDLPPVTPSARIVPPEQLPWVTLARKIRDALEKDALDFAIAGRPDDAHDAVTDALGQWYKAGGLYDALRSHDAESGDRSRRGRAEELKSDLYELAKLAAQAARDGKVDDLKKRMDEVAGSIEAAAGELPARSTGGKQ